MTQDKQQSLTHYSQAQLRKIRQARAEILHYAEPEDPYIHWAITYLGPIMTADLLAGRQELTKELLTRTEGADFTEYPEEKLGAALAERIKRWSGRGRFVQLEQEFAVGRRIKAWLAIPEDPDWPQQLGDLGQREPYALWGRGQRHLLAELKAGAGLAIVGSREISNYGQAAGQQLCTDLAQAGKTLVSGGAIGIDTIAHQQALASAQARLPTLALMACGLDRPYPQQNRQLLGQIIEQGLLLGEVPLGSHPTRWRFLQRNRLIAALSSATLVIEARWRSGALNTAHHALELGREVYAVPGQIFSPSSEGCHRLIDQGQARIATHAEKILTDLGQWLQPEQQELSLFGQQQADIFDQLDQLTFRIWDGLPIGKFSPLESLAASLGLEIRTLMRGLSELAQLNLAEQLEGSWRKSKASLGVSQKR